jgi:hypothetical protein
MELTIKKHLIGLALLFVVLFQARLNSQIFGGIYIGNRLDKPITVVLQPKTSGKPCTITVEPHGYTIADTITMGCDINNFSITTQDGGKIFKGVIGTQSMPEPGGTVGLLVSVGGRGTGTAEKIWAAISWLRVPMIFELQPAR